MKKLIIFITVFCLAFLPLLATGCSKPSHDTDEKTGGDDTSPTEETDVLDDLPDVNYNTTLNLLVRLQDQDANYTVKEPTAETGYVDQQVYRAYDAVGERFNVDFHFTALDGYSSGQTAFLNTIIADVNAGGTFHIVAPSYYFGVSLVTQGYYTDLYSLDYLNFDRPWWYSGFNDTCELYGKLYVCAGAYDVGNLKNTYCLVFNEDLVSAYDLDNPYDLYDRNEWTFDKMMEMATDIGSVEGGNIVGIALTRKSTDCLFQASGLKFIDRNADGDFYVSKYSDRAETLYQRLSGYIHANNNVYKYGGTPDITFQEGQTLIAAMVLGSTANLNANNVSFKFGVTVFPKFVSEQDEYYSTTAGSSVFAITVNAPQKEMSAVILGALCAKFHEYVTPAIFNDTLQGRVANQPKAAEMMEKIRDTLYFDFGFIYSAPLSNIANFTSFIESGSYDSMSVWYEAMESGYQTKLSKFLTDYKNIPNIQKAQ